MPAITDPAILNPSAYGSVPVIPATSTNTSQSTSTSTPNLPNYDALASAASMIAQNQMGGQLNPQDLANAQEWAAQRGVATGTGFGSPNNMAAYQQFLGLSAQQLEQQGVTNYEGLLAGAPRTTNTSGSQTIDNNVLAAEYAAAPNPYAAAMANLAAQQAGLSGGAVAGSGGTIHPATSGSSAGTGGQSAYQAAQAAAAAHGMGTTAGGAGTAPSAFSPGTGPAGGAPAISAGAGGTAGGTAGGSSAYGYQPTSAGSMYMGSQAGYESSGGQYGANGGMLDAYGNEWLPLGDGSYMNMNTGEVSQNPGGGGLAANPDTGIYDYGSGYTGSYGGNTGTTGNLNDLGFGDWYSGGADTGGGTAWQQAGYSSEQAYNDAIDESMFGWDTGGGGGSDWFSGGYSGGMDQTVYNPGTDQSQYNYGIPDYYGTGYDTSGGGGYEDPYAGTYWDTGGGDYYDGG